MSFNQLCSLPVRFGELSNLQELWIDGNQLSFLPNSLINLINLHFLNIENNYLTYDKTAIIGGDTNTDVNRDLVRKFLLNYFKDLSE